MTPPEQLEEIKEIDEADLINVRGKDGLWHKYLRPKMGIEKMTNGKMSNNFYQGAVRTVEILKIIGFALGILWTSLWGLTEWVIVPQIEKKIEETAKRVAAPLDDRLTIIERAQEKHLLDIAEKSRDYPTKDDLRQEIGDLRNELARR